MRKARLSIAGAQDKLLVYFEDNDFYLPLTSGSATTHILKPSNAGFPDIQRNETFCMELARKIGLPVPESRLIKIGAHELFVINRYDRKKTEKKVMRIHQEDFCQAMGVPADRKYQESGGPGFLQCRRIVDEFLFKQGADIRTNLRRIKFLLNTLECKEWAQTVDKSDQHVQLIFKSGSHPIMGILNAMVVGNQTKAPLRKQGENGCAFIPVKH